VIGVGPNPEASFNPESVEPQIGEGTEVGELACVVGDVTIGPNSEISDRASVRADEGTPIVIGANAVIEERVTFHALEETSIEVGDDLTAGDDAVLHGPLVAGNGLTVGDDSVVFRVIVEDDVTVGDGVTLQGPALEEGEELSFTIPAGTVIPDGAVITDEASLQEVLNDQ
jgi:carbonic anhydrase/acetyltransferase-like protein (isoleucine patch superfamily)